MPSLRRIPSLGRKGIPPVLAILLAPIVLILLAGCRGEEAPQETPTVLPSPTPTLHAVFLAPGGLRERVEALIRDGDLERAMTEVDEFTRSNPQSPVSRQMRVKVLAAQGQFGAAVDEYERFLSATKEHSAELLLDIVVSALQEKDNVPKEFSVGAMGDTGSGEVVDYLLSALQDKRASVRRSAARALGEVRDVRAMGPLREALEDDDTQVRQEASRALGRLGEPGAIADLLKALQDPKPEVRWSAALALGDIGDLSAAPDLEFALRDDDPRVRLSAVVALWELTQQAAPSP